MSKVPQDPTKFGYRADAKVVLTGQEFTVLQHLAQKAIGNGVVEKFIQAYEWVNVKSGETVDQPTQEQIQGGLVTRVPSKTKTLQNKQISYRANLHPEIFDGNEVVFRVHMRNIENNIATSVETLEAEYKERQAAEAKKGQMNIIADGKPDVAPAPEQAEEPAEK